MMKRYFSGFLALFLVLVTGVAASQGLISRYVAGDHYKVIEQPLDQPDDGKVHVVEFFLYSCPHCYHLEPEVNEWRAQLGDDVVFNRVPVLFGNAGQNYAKLFYTVEALGLSNDIHKDIFRAIHEQGKPLSSQSAMRKFMGAHGVEGDRFDKVFDSDAVNAKVRDAAEMMRRFRVTATPSLGVAGKYWITGRMAGSNDAMFNVADYLIKRQEGENDG